MILPPVAVAAVAVVAGHHVPVTCDLADDRLWGEYAFYLDRIRLRPMICAAITRFIAGADDSMAAAAVLDLAHEASHADGRPGWANERVTECRAWRALGTVGWMLGASVERAAGLQAESAWVHDWRMGGVPC